MTRDDFDRLDSWLVGRLAALFDKALQFADLAEIKATIHSALAKRQEIYARVQKALTSRYGAAFSATWQRTTATTAVFDVEFDTTDAGARDLLARLLQASDFDAILGAATPAVHIRAGVLTHEATRKTTLDLSLPHVDLQRQTINDALASVQADASGPGILAYQVSGSDVVTQKNRYRSSLAISAAATVAASASPWNCASTRSTAPGRTSCCRRRPA